MASGDLITKVADKETLDKTYANTNAILAAVGADVRVKDVKRYGMKINKNDSNPATRCTYLFDAVGKTPAGMNYTAGSFDFGDWADVFFIKNNYPAMVKYDGTEEYKLDPNDHAKKADGTASDVSNVNYGGNAMSVFDGTIDGKIWLSQFEIGNYEYIVISNEQYDESFNDDAYVREDGSHAEKLYYPMFGGSFDGTRLRSIAGQRLMRNTTAPQEIDRAKANSTTAKWNIGSWSKRNLLNCLLKLISKTDNTQAAFGRGQDSGYVNNESQDYGKLPTGTLVNKGQFFGYNDGTHDVKVFFIEKWWGDGWDRMLGLINKNGHILVKMTPPYNLTGAGYKDTGLTPSGTSGGYISKSKSSKYGRIPYVASGSSTTYQCDGLWFNNGIVAIALVGGCCYDGELVGAAYLNLGNVASNANWALGASVFLEQPIAA